MTNYTKSRILNNVSWLFFDRIFRGAGGFITVAMLANYLGANEFGKLSFITAIVGIFGVFSSLGLKDALVRRFVKSDSNLLALVLNSFYLRLVSGCLGIAAVVGVVHILRPHEPGILLLSVAIGSSLLFQSSEIFKFWFESQLKSKIIVISESVVIYSFLVIKWIMIALKAQLISFAIVFALESLFQLLVMLYVFTRTIPLRFSFSLNASIINSIVYESLPLLLSGIVIISTIHIDKILIGLVFDDHMVGVFTIASQIFLFVMSFIVIFEVSLYPKLVAECDDNRLTVENIGNLYRRINLIQLALIFLSFLFSDFVFSCFFGSDFAGASQLFNYFMITSVIITFARAFDQYHKTLKLFKYLAYRQFFILVLNVVFFLLLAPILGVLSVVVASALSYLLVVLSTVFWGPRRQDVKILYLRILGCI